jgi:hypothetical protein
MMHNFHTELCGRREKLPLELPIFLPGPSDMDSKRGNLEEIRKCLAALEIIAKSDEPRSIAAQTLVNYLQQVLTIQNVEDEDQILARRLKYPGLNPANHILAQGMSWNREQKAVVLRSIREEFSRNCRKIREALNVFPHLADNPIPTDELIAAETSFAAMLKQLAEVTPRPGQPPVTPPELEFRSPRRRMIYRALRSLGTDASSRQVANWIDKYCEKDSSDLDFWEPGAEQFLTEVVEHDPDIRKAFEDGIYAVRKEMKAAEDAAGCKYH